MRELLLFALLSSAQIAAGEECCGNCEQGKCDSVDKEFYSSMVEKNEEAYFRLPGDWELTPRVRLNSHVVIHATGSGEREVRPTLNLATEKTTKTLKEYIAVVREINEAEGREFKNLGTIETESGPASLSQVDLQTKWGTSRMLHAILVEGDTAYILTASALKEEFPDNYETFFDSLKSLHVPKKS